MDILIIYDVTQLYKILTLFTLLKAKLYLTIMARVGEVYENYE